MNHRNHDDQVFEQFLKDSLNPAIPPEVESRLRSRLTAFCKKIEYHEVHKEKTSLLSLRGRTSMVKIYSIMGIAAAIIIVFLGLYLKPWSEEPDKAYASVVKQFENAKTMTYTLAIKMEGAPEMHQEHFYKEPGYMRANMSFGSTIAGYLISDMVHKKAISVISPKKQYMEMDFDQALKMYGKQPEYNIIEHMRSLPKRADKEIGTQEIDNRLLRGYLVTEEGMKKTVWIDSTNEDLVRIDMELLNMKGVHYVIKDIKFNVLLSDTLFNLKPPEGYTPIKIEIDYSQVNENDLIFFLRFWTSHSKEETFPPTFSDQAELMKSMKLLNKPKKEENEKEFGMKTMRGFMFVLQKMKSENDWHYAGKNVKFGAADKPIAWWKPDSSKTYRVIYGDLQIKDVEPDDIKKPEFGKR